MNIISNRFTARRYCPGIKGVIAALTAVAFAAVLPMIAQAATFTVTTNANTGVGSLRAAIAEANLDGRVDTIVFDESLNGQTITLENELLITEGVVIDGPGPGLLTLDGNDTVRIFRIIDANAMINGLTLTRGWASEGFGGAILSGNFDYDRNVTLRLTNCVISDSVADYEGGGIFAEGALVIEHSTIRGNAATDDYSRGGGVLSFEELVVTGSTIADNRAGLGGGIAVGYGSVTLINSTLSGNSALMEGGGLYWENYDDQILLIAQSTITANTAREAGGGIIVYGYYHERDSKNVALQNSIFWNNFVHSGRGPDIYFENWIALDFAASVNNLISDDNNSGFVDGVNGNIVNVGGSIIGPLQNNHGWTFTHRPVTDSVVIDAGDNTIVSYLTLAADQRGEGFPRMIDERVDIGAVEFDGMCIPLDDMHSDADHDGMPDPIETTEGHDACAKDNDVFQSSRLYVMQLYRDFLEREADGSGLDYWQGEIDFGRLTYADMGVAFVLSEEFLSQVNARFPGVTDPDELYVIALYVGMLQRLPDLGGFDFWVGRLRDGEPMQAMVQSFLDSLEYSCRFLPCS